MAPELDGPTLDAWVEDLWESLPIRPRTRVTYECTYRRHIRPTFGQRPIASITRRQIQTWANAQPPVRANAVLPVFRTIMREAFDDELISVNPLVGVKKPAHIAKRREFLTLDEVKALDFGTRWTPVIVFLASTGLRWSEFRALTADDFDGDWIHVTKSGTGVTKSGKARKVPNPGGWDTSFQHTSHKRAADALHETAGKQYCLHSLRRTFAYELLQKGVPVHVAQRLLGHASVELTVNLYGDVRSVDLEAAARLLRPAEPLEHLATVECESCAWTARSDQHKAIAEHTKTGHRLHWH